VRAIGLVRTAVMGDISNGTSRPVVLRLTLESRVDVEIDANLLPAP